MKSFKVMAASLLILALAGCGTTSKQAGGNVEQGSQGGQSVQAASSSNWPTVLRLGVLPGEEEGKLSRGNKQFVEDLGKELGIKTELYVGEDYTAVVEAMRTKKIDIASFGPFSYIIAAERSGAVAMAVKAVNEKEATYQSLIVVPAASPAQKISDLKGKTFLFADPASTSGHLFPRAAMIKELGITNDKIESFFSNVSFSGGHDKSILAIAKGTADGAGVCDTCIKRVVDAGLVKESDYRVIGKSDPIPQSPMAYRKDLPADLIEKIKQFMLNYHKDNKNPAFFSNGTQQFFLVDDSKYNVVRETAKALNMSPEQLLK
ncbi:phosphate/phosphite/phosphonate ABC transporter substrate-binding protein [Paenibacillus sp. NPDC056579]|uniref:phosphate/phosphite/phosphonate ABC transporter substrate-binding protein n=1 Tax=unclassified Paenibacillus TaxID=185978 RepID=UPI001EF8BAB5|nr:phosphate/phosphite/phosphonate ABC transporter substrate-binding protein [Paenibacillus sp. H1-7]